MPLGVIFVVPDVSVKVAVLLMFLVLLNVVPQDCVRDVGMVRRSVVLLGDMVLLKSCVRGRPFFLRLLATAVPVRVKVQPSVRGRGQEGDSLAADDLEEEAVGQIVAHGCLDPALPAQRKAAVVATRARKAKRVCLSVALGACLAVIERQSEARSKSAAMSCD